jgi:hypothetical protein
VVHEVGAWERFGERYPWAVAAAALFGCLAILGIGAAVLVAVAISLSAAAR